MTRHTVPFVRVVRWGQPAWRHTCGRIQFRDLLDAQAEWNCQTCPAGSGAWIPLFVYIGDLCDQCKGNGWVPISGKVDGALAPFDTITECTACRGTGLPYPLGPADYPIQLREAVLEAEDNEDDRPDDDGEDREYRRGVRRGYALGLRLAAGMHGLPEGQDPATRRRAAAGQLPPNALTPSDLPPDWFMPPHLRDDAPNQQCSGCGRKTWSTGEFGKTCGMTMPGSDACQGAFSAQRPD